MKKGGAEEAFKRKRKSLILKSKSVSSVSFNTGLVKEKSQKSKRKNGKKSETGLATPPSYLHNGGCIIQNNGRTGSSTHINISSNQNLNMVGGFLTRPKAKVKVSRIEKEIEEITENLRCIRNELTQMKSVSSFEQKKSENKHHHKTTSFLVQQHRSHDSMSDTQNENKRLQETKNALVKKIHGSKSRIQLVAAFKSEGAGSDKGSRESSSSKKNPKPNSKNGELVKHLINNIPNPNQHKKEKVITEDLIESIICGISTNCGKSADAPQDPSPTISVIKRVMKSLVQVVSEVKKEKKHTTKSQQTETRSELQKMINFSNINLAKSIEEYIKKVIISSPTVKYTENSLPQYFDHILNMTDVKDSKLSETQKQALFVSIYELLQKQLLVEVTLEMIKESGVSIPNLFQYTFTKLGLDYEKYVEFESNRDNDLSQRSIYKGEPECSFEERDNEAVGMLLTGLTNYSMPNHFPLDFYKLHVSKDKDASVEEQQEQRSTIK